MQMGRNEKVKDVVEQVDSDGSGEISFEEFKVKTLICSGMFGFCTTDVRFCIENV